MKKIFLVVAAISIGSQLQAQQDTLVKTLDELVITATKSPVKQSQTGKVISIIDQSTLQRNAGKTLTEILNYQTGIFINGANNNPGSNQDFYFRGAGSGNVLILIDGIPVSDPSQSNNSFDLNNISPAMVEKIEILKGAQSTLWGSDAVAGVVNIVTKKGGTKKISPNVLLSYGSYNTFRGNAGINGKVDNFHYNLTYSHTTTKGFSSAYDSTGNKNFDKDGFEQNNFQANLAYQFTPKISVKGLASFGKYKADIDFGAFTDDRDYTIENKNNLYSFDFGYTSKKISLHYVQSFQQAKRYLNDDSSQVGGPYTKFAKAHFYGNSTVSELFTNFKFSKFVSLVAGSQVAFQNTDQNWYSIDLPSPWDPNPQPYKTALGDTAKTTNTSLYASLLLTELDGFNTELGFRYNHHSIYGNNLTYTFNPSYNIDENTKVFINISSGFKVPSLYQLYSEYGNKNLEPEKSNSYEIGLQAFSNNQRNSFRAVAFKRDIKKLIVFYTDMTTFKSQYINRDEQHDYGFELESTVAIGKAGTWINSFTYVDGEGENNGVKTRNLYRRPNFIVTSILTLQPCNGFTVMPSFKFVGTRLKGQYDAGPAQMPQYYTLDLYSSYDFAKNFRAFVDCRNITNQKYFDIVGYNSRKFNWAAGISANF